MRLQQPLISYLVENLITQKKITRYDIEFIKMEKRQIWTSAVNWAILQQ